MDTNKNYCFAAKTYSTSDSLKRLQIYSSRSVANAIKKFDNLDSSPDSSNPSPVHLSPVETVSKKETKSRSPSRLKTPPSNNQNVKLTSELTSTRRSSPNENSPRQKNNTSSKPPKSDNPTNGSPPIVRYRCPSPSLLRKTQAVIAKEQCNEYYLAKNGLLSPNSTNQRFTCPKSPVLNKREKPKSESFQKAAAFWNSPKT